MSSILFFTAVYLIGMISIVVHIYFSMVRPVIRVQDELKNAAEESRKAEVIRKEFVANVSHELKTPLTSISGFIETLQQGAAEDPEIRTRFIDIIAIETARLNRLIEDLLVLSDIENRKRVGENNIIHVKEAVSQTIEALQPIAEDKKVRILTQLDESVRIAGNADRFCQMMVNLIENAIKYSDEGGRVWIEAKEAEEKVKITVKDEGIGIAPEHLDRLFERFYRVDKSRSKKAGGTGLGLSIVKHIAALLNAEVRVESTAGEGTTFYVIVER